MKVTREQAAQNRERILDAAAQLFRERGFEGIGVADLMKEAGLTHGGFYGHFSSKEDLIAEASARALTGSLALWSELADRASGDPLSAVAARLFDQQTSRQSGRGLSSGRAWTGRVATGSGRAARRHRLCAFRLSIFWRSWFPANRKRQEDRRPSAPTQHWSAPWSSRARSMIVRFRRKSWTPASRPLRLDVCRLLCSFGRSPGLESAPAQRCLRASGPERRAGRRPRGHQGRAGVSDGSRPPCRRRHRRGWPPRRTLLQNGVTA